MAIRATPTRPTGRNGAGATTRAAVFGNRATDELIAPPARAYLVWQRKSPRDMQKQYAGSVKSPAQFPNHVCRFKAPAKSQKSKSENQQICIGVNLKSGARRVETFSHLSFVEMEPLNNTQSIIIFVHASPAPLISMRECSERNQCAPVPSSLLYQPVLATSSIATSAEIARHHPDLS